MHHLILILVLALGCGSSKILVPGPDGNIVEIKQSFSGKGCVAVDSSPDGVSVVVQQSGTSDWGVPRLLSVLPDAVAAFFGGGRADRNMPDPSFQEIPCEILFQPTSPTDPPVAPESG